MGNGSEKEKKKKKKADSIPFSGAISCRSFFGITSASHLQNTDNKIALCAERWGRLRGCDRLA